MKDTQRMVKLHVEGITLQNAWGEVTVVVDDDVSLEDVWEIDADILEGVGDCVGWYASDDQCDHSVVDIEHIEEIDGGVAVLRLGRGDDGDLIIEPVLPNCPDCGADIGHVHKDDCDIERCKSCGGQRISCDCDPPAEGRSVWNGSLECLSRKNE